MKEVNNTKRFILVIIAFIGILAECSLMFFPIITIAFLMILLCTKSPEALDVVTKTSLCTLVAMLIEMVCSKIITNMGRSDEE